MFEELLSPISDEQPSGEYLKDNRSLFRGYRNAFNLAQSSFRQLVETPDALEDAEAVQANAENWDTLSSECFECLKSISKDVEIFSWFTVAQVFTNQPYQRLADALTIFEQVVEQFWDTLQPTLPENKRKGSTAEEQAKEVAENRVKPLLQLVGDSAESGLLYMPLQMLPLVGNIDYGIFFKAEKAGSLASLKEQALQSFASEKSEVEQRILSLGAALEILLKLEKTLSEKCFSVGAQAVSFRFVKDSIERLLKAIEFLVGDQFPRWPLAPEEEIADAVVTETGAQTEQVATTTSNAPVATSCVAASATSTASQVTALSSGAAVASREQALAQLQVIADYFLETEPHSPIYMLLRRAVRWGGMALPELLQELIGENASVHQRIEQLAGLESAEHKASLEVKMAASVAVTATEQSPPTEISLPVEAPKPEPVQEELKQNDSATVGLSSIEW